MAESSLSEISSETIRKTLCESIEAQLGTPNYNIHVSSASKSGENNFIGIVYRVVFNRENEFENDSKLILKIAPQHEGRRNQFYSRELFLQEIYMYNEVNRIKSNQILTNRNDKIDAYFNRFYHIFDNSSCQKV